MEVGELFDKFYQEQVDKGTADGSIWEYKSDIEKLMIDYHNAQMEPIKDHIKKVVDILLWSELQFLEITLQNEADFDRTISLHNMELIDIKKLLENDYPEYLTWIIYDLIVLKLKLS